MTQIPFDQLAKQYLQEFLEPLGTVQRNLEVPGESKFIDVWFTPNSTTPAPQNDLGILHRIATTHCLLEPFRNSPTRQEIRTCLLKLKKTFGAKQNKQAPRLQKPVWQTFGSWLPLSANR